MSITLDILSPGSVSLDAGGAKLVQGPPGEAATVAIGSVAKGDEASVINSGSETHAVLDFVLPKGDAGEQGPKGETGDIGPRGATFTPALDAEGVLSWTNDAGFENPAPVSVRGPQGTQGETGAEGPQGPKGDTGERGAQGWTFTPSVDTAGNLSWTNDGSLANPETVNIMGPQGPQGPQGTKGDTGAQGPKGEKGDQGEAGPQGPKGETGPAGETGPQGPAGQDGAQGPAGADGAPGADGKSAYQYALEAGYTGTESDLSAALAGLGDLNSLLDAINGEVV